MKARHTESRCLHQCTMPDLNGELEELHAAVVRAVRDRIESNPEVKNDDLRVAMQLLKQNSITASLDKDQAAQLKSRMASKLDFSALQGKVVPIKGAEPKRHV